MSHPLKLNPKHFLYLFRWILIILPVASVIGALNAFFLWLLSEATSTRETNTWLLYLLPFAGLFIVYLYNEFGKNSAGGNNLIIDEIYKQDAGIAKRMGPLVLITTVITHLFGGSAGREGTAVQIGGATSYFFSGIFKLSPSNTRILLISSVAAGFGSIFGTPLTGAIFALEVLAIGRIKYDAILPAIFAAIIADTVATALGAHHTHFQINVLETFHILDHVVKIDPFLLLKVILAGIGFGLAGYLFSELTYSLKDFFKVTLKNPYLTVFVGGILVILLTKLIGNYDYIGLGVYASREGGVSIVSAFHEGGAEWYSWLFKLGLTALTLSVGFKGGEVTPLFFIGATLGNTLAWVFGAPPELFAALGLIAVFAAATNTPLACTIMGVELFGSEYLLYFAVVCYTAYFFSGHTGIYASQRIAVSKLFDYKGEAPFAGRIGELREKQPSLFVLLINKIKK
ncbi:voltage-gated chloride channel protein [Psychromonas sp. RZ22]|uniref:voltage-gated chloride channel family protein n=1 Tax=Psychromonas algarum TaxID=2555643 RepID=UPI001067DC07|nr:voltage-gated chloride channel family protein [Psychromonas sp. RZ22]TEW54953.1 voltage-gated chloride channel protein [Psychromonas sp. RZ22]